MALSSLPTGSGYSRGAAGIELLCCVPYGAYILCNIYHDSNAAFTLEPSQERVAPYSAEPLMSTVDLYGGCDEFLYLAYMFSNGQSVDK